MTKLTDESQLDELRVTRSKRTPSRVRIKRKRYYRRNKNRIKRKQKRYRRRPRVKRLAKRRLRIRKRLHLRPGSRRRIHMSQNLKANLSENKFVVSGLNYLLSVAKKAGDNWEDAVDTEEVNDHLKEVLGLNHDDIEAAYAALPEKMKQAQEESTDMDEIKKLKEEFASTDRKDLILGFTEAAKLAESLEKNYGSLIEEKTIVSKPLVESKVEEIPQFSDEMFEADPFKFLPKDDFTASHPFSSVHDKGVLEESFDSMLKKDVFTSGPKKITESQKKLVEAVSTVKSDLTKLSEDAKRMLSYVEAGMINEEEANIILGHMVEYLEKAYEKVELNEAVKDYTKEIPASEMEPFLEAYPMCRNDVLEGQIDGEKSYYLPNDVAKELDRSQKLFTSRKPAEEYMEGAKSKVKEEIEKAIKKKKLKGVKVEVYDKVGDSYVGSDAAAIYATLKSKDKEVEFEPSSLYYKGMYESLGDGMRSWTWAAWLGAEESPFHDEDFVEAYAETQAGQAMEQFAATLNEGDFYSELDAKLDELAQEDTTEESVNEASPKQVKKGEEGEIVKTLDDTTTIWKNKNGYYWLEKHLGQMSTQYFKSEKEAEKDARDSVDVMESLRVRRNILKESGGSGWGNYKPGKEITNIHDLRVGKIYLDHSDQFDANNVVQITKIKLAVPDPKADDYIAYMHFVDPNDFKKKRQGGDQEFAVWDHDLGQNTHLYELGEQAPGPSESLEEKKLSSKEKAALPKSAFALPGERKYPIHDKAHAKNALARVSANGTPAEKKKVTAAVHAKYPSLKKESLGEAYPESAAYSDNQTNNLAEAKVQWDAPAKVKATTLSVLLKKTSEGGLGDSVHTHVSVKNQGKPAATANLTLRFDRGEAAMLAGYPMSWGVYDLNVDHYNQESPTYEEIIEMGGYDEETLSEMLPEMPAYVSRETEIEIFKQLKKSLEKQFADPMFKDHLGDKERQEALAKMDAAIAGKGQEAPRGDDFEESVKLRKRPMNESMDLEWKKLPNGDLEVSLKDPKEAEEIKDHEDFHETFEEMLRNGMDSVSPEEVGALTDAPIFGDVTRGDNGDIEEIHELYWFPDYAVEGPSDVLKRDGKVVFKNAKDEVEDVSESKKKVNEALEGRVIEKDDHYFIKAGAKTCKLKHQHEGPQLVGKHVAYELDPQGEAVVKKTLAELGEAEERDYIVWDMSKKPYKIVGTVKAGNSKEAMKKAAKITKAKEFEVVLKPKMKEDIDMNAPIGGTAPGNTSYRIPKYGMAEAERYTESDIQEKSGPVLLQLIRDRELTYAQVDAALEKQKRFSTLDWIGDQLHKDELKGTDTHKRVGESVLGEADPSLQPPKRWFNKMAKRIKKTNPDYDKDKVKATIGDIWYHKLGQAKKQEIRGREGKTLGPAESVQEASDPKPTFNIGDRVERDDKSDQGVVTFIAGYDPHLGDYRYKVKQKDGSIRHWNGKSMRLLSKDNLESVSEESEADLEAEYGPAEKWTDALFDDFDFESAIKNKNIGVKDKADEPKLVELLAYGPEKVNKILNEPDVLGVPIVGFDWDSEIKPYIDKGEAYFADSWPVGEEDGGAVGAFPFSLDKALAHLKGSKSESVNEDQEKKMVQISLNNPELMKFLAKTPSGPSDEIAKTRMKILKDLLAKQNGQVELSSTRGRSAFIVDHPGSVMEVPLRSIRMAESEYGDTRVEKEPFQLKADIDIATSTGGNEVFRRTESEEDGELTEAPETQGFEDKMKKEIEAEYNLLPSEFTKFAQVGKRIYIHAGDPPLNADFAIDHPSSGTTGTIRAIYPAGLKVTIPAYKVNNKYVKAGQYALLSIPALKGKLVNAYIHSIDPETNSGTLYIGSMSNYFIENVDQWGVPLLEEKKLAPTGSVTGFDPWGLPLTEEANVGAVILKPGVEIDHEKLKDLGRKLNVKVTLKKGKNGNVIKIDTAHSSVLDHARNILGHDKVKDIISGDKAVHESVLKEESSDPLEQYLETALWSSTGDDEQPLDKTYGLSDFSAEALEQAKKDWESFVDQAGELISGEDITSVAHDFWLTRNRHGAGFWDGHYDEATEKKLTDLAHGFGETDLYVGDDGKLYFSR